MTGIQLGVVLGGSAGGIVVGPVSYDVRLSNTNHDSRYYDLANIWHAAAPLVLSDYGASGHIVSLFSFLGTEAFSAAGVSAATLTLTTTAVDLGGTWTVRTELANDAAKGIWTGTHHPPATLSTAVDVQTSTTEVPQEHSVNVAAMVNEVMASTYWSPGDPINFVAQREIYGDFVGLTFAAVPSGSAARLVMVPA